MIFYFIFLIFEILWERLLLLGSGSRKLLSRYFDNDRKLVKNNMEVGKRDCPLVLVLRKEPKGSAKFMILGFYFLDLTSLEHGFL